jgi:thiol-disulfide isomerase/thioredoxin
MHTRLTGWPILLVSVLTLGSVCSFSLGRLSSAQPKLTPKEQFEALVKEFEAAAKQRDAALNNAKTREEFKKTLAELAGRGEPKTYAPKFIALIKDHPQDNAALDALTWLLAYDDYVVPEVHAVIVRHWVQREEFVEVCRMLMYDPSHQGGDPLLQAAIEKSPHAAVLATARFALAESHLQQADLRAGPGYKAEEREKLQKKADELLQEVIDNFGSVADPRLPKTTLAKSAEKLLFELRHLSIGKPAPEIRGKDIDGKQLQLSAFKGKVVLLVFWATWCGACMADVPHQRELVKQYAGKPFAIVGINSDQNRDVARKACLKEEITWPSFWDGEQAAGPIVGKWNVNAWPTLYLVDAKMVIRYKTEFLRRSSVRKDQTGNLVQFSYLDDAVAELVMEAIKAK